MTEREASVVVRFVKVTQESLDLMQEAFEAVCETGGKSVWFPAEDCLRVAKKDRHLIYVFSSFSGHSFEHIASTGSRIYGPSCVLQCVKNGETLPRLLHPVFCKAMEGFVISCTNLPSNLRDELHLRVNWMMGEASKDFHERVTHLIAGEVGSKKYTVAVTLKKKIMSPEWVSTVWERCQSGCVLGDDSQFDSLRCPPFKGFVISVSGFSNEERTRIKNLVEKAGGYYSGEMKINECTHLVVTMARGQKYEFARKWKINIVSPKWIYDCISSGYCLQELLYAVEKQTMKADDLRSGLTSTPSGESLEVANASILSNMSAVSMTTINDTALKRQSSSSSLPTQGPVLKRFNSSSSGTLPEGQSKTSKAIVAELLDSTDLNGAKAGFFLDGCKIYISGISTAYLERVRRIINLGGGTRFNQINESVSHVVMGEIVDETVQRLQEASFRPQVVSIQWLVDCFRLSQWMPEDQYRCIDLPDLHLASSPASKRKMRKTVSAENKREEAAATAAAGRFVALNDARTQKNGSDKTLTSKECDDEMQELLSQYAAGVTTSSCPLGESTLMRAAEAGEACVQNAVNVAIETSIDSRNDEEATIYVHPPNANEDNEESDDVGDEECETTAVGPLFAQLKFMVFGFELEEEEMLCSLIKEHGGIVLPPVTRSVADFGVVPLFGCPVTVTVGDVVTNAWLQMSIESEQVLPVEENIIYTPLPLVSNAQPLVGCILSVSGYLGIERDVLLEVSQALGGKCQDYFLRRAKGNLLASTHLIVKSAEGSKYVAAKKWNVPAVNKMWLFECARTGKRVDVEKYMIDDFPDESAGIRNLPHQSAVELIAPPPIMGVNKRAHDCTSDLLTPTKRSRSSAVTGVPPSDTSHPPRDKSSEILNEDKDSAANISLGGSAVFKRPALPSAAVGDSAGRGSRRTLRAIRSSSVSNSESSASPLSKNSRKMPENGNSMTDDCPSVIGSSTSVDGTVPAHDNPATTKEDTVRMMGVELADGGSVFAKNCFAGEEENMDVNCKKPVFAANPSLVSVFHDVTKNRNSESAPEVSKWLKPSGLSDKHLMPDSCVRNSAEDSSKLRKIQMGIRADVCETGKNEDAELLNKDNNSSSLTNPVKESAAVHVIEPPIGGAIYRRTPKNSRVEELIQGERRMPSSSVGAFSSPPGDVPEGSPEVDTPSKFMNGKVFHPKLNLHGVLSPWISPVEVAKKQTRVSLPLEEVFAENIGIAIKNSISGWGKEDSFSQRMQDEDYCLRTEPDESSGPLKGVVIAVGKKLSKNQSEYNNIAASLGADYRWTYDSGCTHFIFQGRLNDTNKEFRMARDQGKFIVSPYWLTACEEQNCRVDESNFPHTYNPNMSLSITAHKTPARPTRTSARTNTNPVRTSESVATHTNIRLSKAAEPVACPVVDERSETSAAKSDEAEKTVASTVEEKDEDFEATDLTISDEDFAKACGELENQEKSTRESALIDGLKRLNEASKNHGRGKPLTRILSSEKDALNVSDSKLNRSLPDISSKDEIDDKKTASVSKSNTNKVNPMSKMLADLHTQPSQFVEVVWDDPGAREQREMLASDLAKNSESLSPHRSPGHELQAVEKMTDRPANKVAVNSKSTPLPETRTEPQSSTVFSKKQLLGSSEVQKSSTEKTGELTCAKTLPTVLPSPTCSSVLKGAVEEAIDKIKRKPVFIFSGLSAEERDRFTATVEMLGGLALDTANCTNECSHLIIEKPTRNEKYLACVATGKWVLHKSYLDACTAAKEFLPEESYEWGGKATATLWSSLPLQLVKLAEAAHRWRLHLAKVGKRGSSGHGSFETWKVLLLTESRREDGFRRLLEAGGATVLSNKLPLDYSKATHAFIDLSKLKFKIDLEGMLRCGVSCLKPEYIASFLTDHPLPDLAQFYIPEVEKFFR